MTSSAQLVLLDLDKRCSSCREMKSPADFGRNRTDLGGKRYVCKACENAAAKAYRLKNPSKVKEATKRWAKNNPEKMFIGRRRRNLKKNYGLSLETFDALLSSQGGRCAICRHEIDGALRSRGRRWDFACVDHDHHTGAVRGLLCGRCNGAIGLLREDLEIIEAAGRYLKERRRYD